MGRFYVELTLTVHADAEDEATQIGEAAAHLIRTELGDEGIGNVELTDVDDDSDSEGASQ